MTKKTIDVPIPLGVAVAWNHLEQARKHVRVMEETYRAAALEAIEKQQMTVEDLGSITIFGVERRPEGYVVPKIIYDEEE